MSEVTGVRWIDAANHILAGRLQQDDQREA